MLAILPEDLALDVVNRMLKMEAVQKEMLERVEQTLRTEFMSNLSQTRRRDAHEVMAEIFNNFDRQTETRFITALEEGNREAAERIKALMFTFDDLVQARRRLGADADAPRRQGQARRRAQGRLRGGARSSSSATCPTRAAKMLVDDMEAMGPVRLRDVDEAQIAAGQPRQGSRRQGRDHHRQAARRRRAGLLSMARCAAKFLFDTDFAPERQPRRSRPIAPAEHALKLAEAESKGFADGFAAAEKERVARGRAPHRGRVRADRRRARPPGARPRRGRRPARGRSRRGRGRGRPQARAGADRARAVRRDRGARHRMLPAARHRAARRGARQRRAARHRQGAARRGRAHPRLRGPPGRDRRAATSRSATAGSNGPTAASTATAARPMPRSPRWSAATSTHAANGAAQPRGPILPELGEIPHE